MICSKCSTQNADTNRFCMSCGASLGVTHLGSKTLAVQAAVPSAQPSPPSARPSPAAIMTAVKKLQRAIPRGLTRLANTLAGQRELEALVIDVSGSMDWKFSWLVKKLQAAKDAAVAHVQRKAKLDADDEIAVVRFSDSADVVHPLTRLGGNEQSIANSIEALSIMGGTDLDTGLAVVRDQVFDWQRRDVVRRIILLTDGQGGNPRDTAEDLKSRGVVIDCMGVGADPTDVDEDLLRSIASVIEGQVRYRFIKDRQDLDTHFTSLAVKTATA